MPSPKYNRIMLKLSGEALMGSQNFGIDPDTIRYVANEVKSVCDSWCPSSAGCGGRKYISRDCRQLFWHGPGVRRPHGNAGHGDQ